MRETWFPSRERAEGERRSCRLPELESVPFKIGRPAEPAELHLLHPFVDGDARSAELVEHRVQIAHAEVDHRLLPGRAEVLAVVQEGGREEDRRLERVCGGGRSGDGS